MSSYNAHFHGPLRRNPANPRYFTDDSGQAVYLTGSHTWSVMQDMWPENEERRNMDYDGFLRMLTDYGHNFLRFWQFTLYTRGCPCNKYDVLSDPLPYLRTGPGLANDGLPKFDLTKFNEAYFDRLRERVIKAGQNGIYSSVMMFEAWSLKWAAPDKQPWVYHVFNPANNVNGITDDPVYPNGNYWGVFTLKCPAINEYQKAFVAKVIDTVNGLDNVLYEICNEVPFTLESLEWQKAMCAYIREYEAGKPKRHMIGITPEGGDDLNERYMDLDCDWYSPSNGWKFEYRYNPSPSDGRKVLLNDTDHLWGHGCEVSWIWKSFTRGMNVLFMDPWEPFPGDLDWWQDGDVSRNGRYYYAWDGMRRNLGLTRALAKCFDLNLFVPDLDFCTSTYCLANKGSQYICYFPAGGYEGVDLRGTDGEFTAEWLDPATGITHKGGAVRASGAEGVRRAALRAPFDGPAVLLLFKERKYIPPRWEIYRRP